MIINIAHTKGGVGKSTLATNLAVELNCPILDLDKQGSSKYFNELRVENKKTPLTVILAQSRNDLAILQEIELKNMYDFYARVYVGQISNNLFDIHIIGYITKQNFIKNSVIKRMPQYGKSEQALYIATQIKNGTKFN